MKAISYFNKATDGLGEPTAAMFYNDQPADKIFYQGMAWKKLGNKEKAQAIFNRLIEYGRAHRNDEVRIDFFAVSLPDLLIFEDDLNRRNQVHCDYIMGLGYLGMHKMEEAAGCFEKVLAADNMHFGARTHAQMIDGLLNLQMNNSNVKL
jgi:tetratricopeptide (TPR) repeat protein